jgi:hypothetical protein
MFESPFESLIVTAGLSRSTWKREPEILLRCLSLLPLHDCVTQKKCRQMRVTSEVQEQSFVLWPHECRLLGGHRVIHVSCAVEQESDGSTLTTSALKMPKDVRGTRLRTLSDTTGPPRAASRVNDRRGVHFTLGSVGPWGTTHWFRLDPADPPGPN